MEWNGMEWKGSLWHSLLVFSFFSPQLPSSELRLRIDLFSFSTALDCLMSWATCYSGCNNIHPDMPPLMSDGRTYASWQPEAAVNRTIQQMHGVRSNWQYRQFLQQHANAIMEANTGQACYEIGLEPHRVSSAELGDNVPFQFEGVYDSSIPRYGYSGSDLKSVYLSREQLQARMVAPAVQLDELLTSEDVRALQESFRSGGANGANRRPW